MKWIALLGAVGVASGCRNFEPVAWDVALRANRHEIGVKYLGELEELPLVVRREATDAQVRVWVKNTNTRPIPFTTVCASDAPLRLGKFWDGTAWVASQRDWGCTGSLPRSIEPGEVAMLSFPKYNTASPQQIFVDFGDVDDALDGYRSSVVLLYEDAANHRVQMDATSRSDGRDD